MTEKPTDSCPPKDALVSFLYDEADASTRIDMERHLAHCAACRDEVAAFGRVRTRLAAWELPALETHLAVAVPEAASPEARPWITRPAFMGAAAAVLILGMSAGLANLEVRYDAGGLVLRTGWARQPQVAASAPANPPAPAVGIAPAEGPAPAGVPVDVAGAAAPWQADLEALAQQLRGELATAVPASVAGLPARTSDRAGRFPDQRLDPQVLRQVQALIDESEVRQQRNLALRVAELARDFDRQRDADLVQIELGLGRIEGRTEVEAARSREMMNYIQRVSQQSPPR
jgi:anti-sigma factor RsiW